MKYLLVLAMVAVSMYADEVPATRLVDPSIQARIGFDSNPLGTSGTSAAILGGRDTLVYSAGVGLGVKFVPTVFEHSSLKLTYAGEVVRYDRWSSENFSTHRIGLIGHFDADGWQVSGDASSLYVDGSRDTFLSVPSLNANGISLGRERREQWQHRLKAQAQKYFGTFLLRGTGTVLAYDYNTKVLLGNYAFADRSDDQVAMDLGWKQNQNSLWITGVRVGHQEQAIIPLPNCNFDYSNNYYRVAVGWEGKPFANTTVSFAAGPDFRNYNGKVDPLVFVGGRDRHALWYEGAFTANISKGFIVTGKAVKTDWLSSLGKGAYIDTCFDAAAIWTVSTAWTIRLTAKAHRCDYFPAIRDDWESFGGIGATYRVAPKVALMFDVLRHHGWNNLGNLSERAFQRLVVNVGTLVHF